MIKVENILVMNLENAIRGMRNPLESWKQSDSYYSLCEAETIVGENDKKLALKLIKAGSDHSKFMRQIFVSMDITAPLYWWKEMDTYKVSTVANSTSTMHTLHKNTITKEMFSFDDLDEIDDCLISTMQKSIISDLDILRHNYNLTQDKKYWRALIQLLPSSFNQMRTWTGNYQNLRNIYHARKNHKLSEWKEFCTKLEQLPYSEFFSI